MKKILYLSIISCSIAPVQLDAIKPEKHINLLQINEHNYNVLNYPDSKKALIKTSSVFIPQQLGSIELYHDNNGFSINKKSKSFPIQPCFMDKELRGISTENLARLLAANAYLSVQKIDRHEYALKLKGRLHGGGVGGAMTGFYIGKFASLFICHGAIIIAGALTGPAAPATILALEGCLLPHIMATSVAVSVAGGIIGGVVTEPI